MMSQQHYTLLEDTSLSDLAHQFATTPQTIKELNHLEPEQYRLKTRQTINVPTHHVLIKPPHLDLPHFLKQHHLSYERIKAFNPHFLYETSPQWIALTEKGMAHLPLMSLTAKSLYSPYNHRLSQPEIAVSSRQLDFKEAANRSNGFYSNGYRQGQCTAYAFERRITLGRAIPLHWGDAKYWAKHARREGFVVSHIPKVGAILVSEAGQYGHVAIVEACLKKGVYISEMNWKGEGVISTRFIGNIDDYQYIY
ncbi:CHAP domain-containing protein [Staphylococcus sp. 17KM0847]|uniref:CHAP domain-containing protein n=1 Tax=Staphylococcus sp. 17KM0847 TaxID=2583989 RepID=UPI0015DF4A60|nr:CHAP domain-containing protein [Staphylococcus sp. 17KM0847]